jgi:hypothetical protein
MAGMDELTHDRDQLPVAERIFPTGPVPRDGRIVRTQWVGSWESQLIGVARLTAFLASRLPVESHAIDDIALNIVFLQRHRIEIGLKLVLERADAEIPPTHSLRALHGRCAEACAAAGLVGEWESLIAPHEEFIDLMDDVDPGSDAYRYPVNSKSIPWNRHQFVDVDELESAGTRLQQAVFGMVETLAGREPLPVVEADAAATAQELHELAAACRAVEAFQRSSLEAFRSERVRLGDRRPERVEGVLLAGEAVSEHTLALARRAERMRDQIVRRAQIDPPADPKPLPPLPPLPKMALSFDQRVMAERQQQQIKWFVDAMVPRFRWLSEAVRAVERRTSEWSTPAARQVHLDVARFQSRLSRWESADSADTPLPGS